MDTKIISIDWDNSTYFLLKKCLEFDYCKLREPTLLEFYLLSESTQLEFRLLGGLLDLWRSKSSNWERKEDERKRMASRREQRNTRISFIRIKLIITW